MITRIRSGLLTTLFLLAANVLHAQEATQTINLVSGWNAIWLEVEPQNADPSVVFNTAANTAIQVIASPKPLAGLAETFGSSPTSEDNLFNQAEWEQWQRSDIGNSNLVMITGNRGYLIRTTGAVSNLTVTGKVRFFRPNWTPDRYNLVGFGIDGATKFKDFFAPSAGAHPVARVYTLSSAGNWAPVNADSNIADGKAYWIFCNGPSDYMGPVSVDFDGAIPGTLNFGGPGDSVKIGAENMDLEELVFTNRTDPAATSPLTAQPKLDLRTAAATPGTLTLRVVSPATDSLSYLPGNLVDTNPAVTPSPSSLGESILPQKSKALTLGALRSWVSGSVARTNVYRLHTGGGTMVWLPVKALNADVSLPDGNMVVGPGSAAGLWVGEVVVDSATSIVEDGEPVRKAAGAAPLRLLLHSNGTGAVRLLSQVTIMQTKSADPDVVPEAVLVVDPNRIPFFEGIKERNGKRVGLRMEAVAFDMPRKFDATAQAALLADDAYPDLDDAVDIPGFLNGRSARPTSLKEDYYLSWPLDGTLGSGETVNTNTAKPLNLDPFHRSNPFRHATNRDHVRGPNVDRTISIVFDSASTVADRLSGTYTETLTGLIKTNLTLTGRVELRRVSSVATLEGAE